MTDNVVSIDSAWEQYAADNPLLWRRRCHGHLLYAYEAPGGTVGWHCCENGKGFSSAGATTIDEAKAAAERWAEKQR